MAISTAHRDPPGGWFHHRRTMLTGEPSESQIRRELPLTEAMRGSESTKPLPEHQVGSPNHVVWKGRVEREARTTVATAPGRSGMTDRLPSARKE